MEKILVSVVIPAYNCCAYISGAIASALAQDVPLELLVIDDCSTDGLAQLMDGYRDDPRIRYIQNSHNMGAAATRNRGVSLAQGEYIAFLDADDIWASGKLKLQLQRLAQTGTVICSTARELMTPQGDLTGYTIGVKEHYTYRDILFQNFINCSSVVIATSVAREFPMTHDDGHEDYLMWLQVLKKYRTGCAVNLPLLKYRLSNTGKSGTKWNSAKMTYRTYRHMGFGVLRSAAYFLCYAFYGIKKYFRWFVK